MKKVGLLLLVGLTLAGCEEGKTGPGGTTETGNVELNPDDASAAELLALIDEGPVVDTVKLNRYRYLMNRLGASCRQPAMRIGDFAVNSVKQLEEIGVESSMLEQLEVATDYPPMKDCAALFALVSLERGG